MFPLVHVNIKVANELCFLSAKLRHGKHENEIQCITNGCKALFSKGKPTFSNYRTKERLSDFELTNKFHLRPHLNYLKCFSSFSVKPIFPSCPEAPTHCFKLRKQLCTFLFAQTCLSSGKCYHLIPVQCRGLS